MRPYGFQWVLMRPYKCLFGFLDFNVSLWVLICLIRPYGSSLHLIVPFMFVWILTCPYGSLQILICFYGSSLVDIVRFTFAWIVMCLIGP